MFTHDAAPLIICFEVSHCFAAILLTSPCHQWYSDSEAAKSSLWLMGAVLYVCNLYCTLLHCLCCIICIVLYCAVCIGESSPLIALSASRLLFTGGSQASCHALQRMQKSDRKCIFSQKAERWWVLQKARRSRYHRPAFLNFSIVCIVFLDALASLDFKL